MICPKCGKITVRERNKILYLTYPEQYEERDWCQCGYRGEWEKNRTKTQEEFLNEKWKRMNNVY